MGSVEYKLICLINMIERYNLYKELDKLVLVRSDYLTIDSNYYKDEIKKINNRISELHNLLFDMDRKNK